MVVSTCFNMLKHVKHVCFYVLNIQNYITIKVHLKIITNYIILKFGNILISKMQQQLTQYSISSKQKYSSSFKLFFITMSNYFYYIFIECYEHVNFPLCSRYIFFSVITLLAFLMQLYYIIWLPCLSYYIKIVCERNKINVYICYAVIVRNAM